LELELPRLLAPDLPSNCSSLRDLDCTHSNYKTQKSPVSVFIVTTCKIVSIWSLNRMNVGKSPLRKVRSHFFKLKATPIVMRLPKVLLEQHLPSSSRVPLRNFRPKYGSSRHYQNIIYIIICPLIMLLSTLKMFPHPPFPQYVSGVYR
jgi:hypothetical protein